jgi:hypothetical protein
VPSGLPSSATQTWTSSPSESSSRISGPAFSRSL